MIRSLYRACWTALLALLFSLPFCQPAAAQEFPSKALRVVVPWPAGGLVDVAARLVGVRLQAALGQAVVIDNKVGAGGVIGADLVAKAPADGHTLVFTTSALTINAALRATLGRLGRRRAADFSAAHLAARHRRWWAGLLRGAR